MSVSVQVLEQMSVGSYPSLPPPLPPSFPPSFPPIKLTRQIMHIWFIIFSISFRKYMLSRPSLPSFT